MGLVLWGVLLAALGLLVTFSNVLGFTLGLPLVGLGILLIAVGVVVAVVGAILGAGRSVVRRT